MGATSDYVSKEYGVRDTETVISTLTLVAAAVPVRVLKSDPNRMAWAIFNPSTLGPAMLSFDNAPSATYGIQVNPAGGMVSFDARDDLNLPALAVYGFAAVAVTITIIETRAVL